MSNTKTAAVPACVWCRDTGCVLCGKPAEKQIRSLGDGQQTGEVLTDLEVLLEDIRQRRARLALNRELLRTLDQVRQDLGYVLDELDRCEDCGEPFYECECGD